MLARVAALDKAVPDLFGQKTIEIKLPSEHSNLGDWITFRLTVPLVLMDKGNKDKRLHHLEFALRLLGCNFDEVKTSGWQKVFWVGVSQLESSCKISKRTLSTKRNVV